jgi:hypothetical protein
MAVVSCVTPMSMFQLPTNIHVAVPDLPLGWRRHILFDSSSGRPCKAIAADNNAELKVARTSRRIYNEACSILNGINKLPVRHATTQRFSQTR